MLDKKIAVKPIPNIPLLKYLSTFVGFNDHSQEAGIKHGVHGTGCVIKVKVNQNLFFVRKNWQ